MTKDTSGPAFPVFPETSVGHAASFTGMTLRDYFAAKAVQGILCDGAAWGGEHIHERAAKLSFMLADAMLEARK